MKPVVITSAQAPQRFDVDQPIGSRPVRVSRKCPACFVRANHRGNEGGVAHRIVCVRCGHAWLGRVLTAEQR